MLRLVTSDSEAKVQSHTELDICRKIYLLLDLQPAPPVGFNLTFVCPEGEVLRTFFDLLKSALRCSTMIGSQLRSSSPPANPTGFSILRTGRYSTVSSVSRTRFSVKVQSNPSQLRQQSASTAQLQVGVLKPFFVASQKPSGCYRIRDILFSKCCNTLM